MTLFAGLEPIVKTDEPLSAHTWLGIGGPAQYFAEPRTFEELGEVVRRCRRDGVPIHVMGGGANLLGDTWTFASAPSGSSAFPLPDVTPVPALGFAGGTVGSYDTFSQTFATTPGAEYVYEFMFFNDLGPLGSNAPSGLLVTTSASAVPEPSTWAMMILGLAGIGFTAYRRKMRAGFG